MAHWGWYWKVKKKHVARTSCSILSKIDSFKLLHKGAIGFKIEPLNHNAVIVDDQIRVTYGKHKKSSYSIPIDKQPCNYGGFRYFFKCPLCQQRMRILYFAQKSLFLCRKCLNLGYDTQQLRPSRRYTHTEKKIEALLKDKGGSIYTKPPHMHGKTYKRLMSKLDYYKDKWHQAYNDDLRAWFGAKIEPHIETFFDYVDESKPWRKVKRPVKGQAVQEAAQSFDGT